jgi:ABC-type multidrug transport system fused ATPase/permease subunit
LTELLPPLGAGAGKSSLINSLFRLMELDSGSIRIDGLDISKMGVRQLRSKMAIIPQVSTSACLV